ncbi:MAG: hypothetical protein AB7U83_10865 [Vicinamibacterales bacterium]
MSTPPPSADATKAADESLFLYRCEACGGSAAWQPSKGGVACRSCGTAVPLPALTPAPAADFPLVTYLRDSPENRRTFTPERLDRACPVCGHAVVFPAAVEGTTCPACRTPLLRPPHDADMPIRPTGVIPFAIDEADAHARLREWWRRRRGGDPLTRRLEPGRLVPTYVPCWQFSVTLHCAWRHCTRDGDGKERVLQGEVSGDYGEREPAGHSLPPDLLRTLPFPFEQAVAFDRRYLAGAVVEQYDRDLFDSWSAAHTRLEALARWLVRRDSKLVLGPDESWPSWSNEKAWLILAPFYAATVEVRGTRHHVVVDGHSGQVAGTVPPFIGWGAWLALLAILGGVLALAWWLFSLVLA